MLRSAFLAPLCLVLALCGCHWLPTRPQGHPAEMRAAERLEIASVRLWAEDRPTFPGVGPALAARAWERNLRGLKLKVERHGNLVEARTAEGQAFTLAFWEGKEQFKGKTVGEMTWHQPDEAGRGMSSLLESEAKHRKETAETAPERSTRRGIELELQLAPLSRVNRGEVDRGLARTCLD